MDGKVIRILEFLKPYGFTATVNIAPLLNEMFLYDSNDQEFDFNINKRNVIKFLEGIIDNDLIKGNKDHIYYTVGDYRDRTDLKGWYWNSGFEASITINGLLKISQIHKDKLEEEFNEGIFKVCRLIEGDEWTCLWGFIFFLWRLIGEDGLELLLSDEGEVDLLFIVDIV